MGADGTDLAGRAAVITGAGQGIGRVLALRYARRGVRLTLAGRRSGPLEASAELVRAACPDTEVRLQVADVRSEEDCSALAAAALDHHGRIDVLLNNAAVPGRDQPVAEMDLGNWADALATNLTGPMVLAREVLRQAMLPAGSGNIQFFSSGAAKRVLPGKAHYAASKLALLPLARTLALEVGRAGVRVNTLVLGAIQGELMDAWAEREAAARGTDTAEVLRPFTEGAALGRLATPDEVADVSLWLASDASSAITGQDIDVNAGDGTR